MQEKGFPYNVLISSRQKDKKPFKFKVCLFFFPCSRCELWVGDPTRVAKTKDAHVLSFLLPEFPTLQRKFFAFIFCLTGKVSNRELQKASY